MKRPMAAIGLVGPRPNSWRSVSQEQEMIETETNVLLFDSIMQYAAEKYGKSRFYFATIGCDKGFGLDLAQYCLQRNQRFVEIAAQIRGMPTLSSGKLESFGSQEDFAAVFMARHAALLELCDEFIIRAAEYKTLINDLIARIEASEKPYFIYDNQNQMIKHKGDPKVHGQLQS